MIKVDESSAVLRINFPMYENKRKLKAKSSLEKSAHEKCAMCYENF